jgi:hypothetical protein
MGQEVPLAGYSDLVSVAGASNYPSTITGLTDVNGAAVSGVPVNQATTARRVVEVVNGPQTPQASQPALNLILVIVMMPK